MLSARTASFDSFSTDASRHLTEHRIDEAGETLGSMTLGERIVARARLATAVHMAEAASRLAMGQGSERSVTPDGGTGVPIALGRESHVLGGGEA